MRLSTCIRHRFVQAEHKQPAALHPVCLSVPMEDKGNKLTEETIESDPIIPAGVERSGMCQPDVVSRFYRFAHNLCFFAESENREGGDK